MSDLQMFPQPLVSGRLQVSHRRHRERFDPAEGIALVWAERAVIATGPQAFRVTIPIAGPLPGRASVDCVLDTIRDLSDAAPAARGCSITHVDGHARPLRGLRSCLVLSIACTGAGDDPHRDAAQVSGLVRNAARSCR